MSSIEPKAIQQLRQENRTIIGNINRLYAINTDLYKKIAALEAKIKQLSNGGSIQENVENSNITLESLDNNNNNNDVFSQKSKMSGKIKIAE